MEGLDCFDGMQRVERLNVLPGFWRANELSEHVRPCITPGACVGSRLRTGPIENLCGVNRRGPYCEVCKEGYDKSADGSCYDCGSSSVVGLLPAIVGSSVLLLGLVLLGYRTRRSRLNALADAGSAATRDSTDGVMEWLGDRWAWLKRFGTKIRILLSLCAPPPHTPLLPVLKHSFLEVPAHVCIAAGTLTRLHSCRTSRRPSAHHTRRRLRHAAAADLRRPDGQLLRRLP